MSISFLIAFLAGLATFFSPCILPVIPGYLSVLSGGERGKVFRRTVLFSLGLVLVFTTLGAVIGYIGATVVLVRDLLIKFLGVVLIIYGIHMIKPLPIGLLNREWQLSLRNGDSSDMGAFLLGGAFGIAWTPCSGVILGAVLAQALLFQTLTAAPLLLAFALGTILPMLALALLYQYTGRRVKFPGIISRWYNPVVGMVIVILGLSLLTGWVNYWRADLLTAFPNLERGLLPLAR